MITQLTLNMANPKDRSILAHALLVYSDLSEADSTTAPEPPPPPRKRPKSPAVAKLRQSGKEVTKAATELENQVGDRTKMNTHDRAKLAAEKRWSAERARKAAAPVRPKPAKDFSHATEQTTDDLPQGSEPQEFDPGTIDCRDIMEGNYPQPKE